MIPNIPDWTKQLAYSSQQDLVDKLPKDRKELDEQMSKRGLVRTRVIQMPAANGGIVVTLVYDNP